MKGPKVALLSVVFLFLLIIFTLVKIPQARVTSVVQGFVQMGLDPYGILITDRGRELSVLKGFQYRLDHPSLELPDQTRVDLDELVVTPKWSALLAGKTGVNASLKQGPSGLDLGAVLKGDQIDFTVNLDSIDVGTMGVLAFAASLKGSGSISGTIHAEGALSDPSSLTGVIDLKLKKFHLEEQNVMGFQLPSLNVADGTLQADIKSGKLSMKNVQLGKAGDDLMLTLTGDLNLSRYVNASSMNLRTVFGFSDKVKHSISLLEGILSSAKTSDGKYAYKLTGTLASPFTTPDPK